jgi:phytoene dehydrogenase-like protein
MSNRYDMIVIGAGLNGLTAATLMAKRGRKVLVVEKRPVAGGLAAGEEFHPGYRSSGVLHDTSGLRPWAVDALDLKRHGLKIRKEEVPVFIPQASGRGLLLWRNAQRAEEELGPLSPPDVKAYKDYRAFIGRMTPFLSKVFDEFPPDVTTMSFPGLWDILKKAVSLRMLGKADMMEMLRIGPMCVADWLNEWFKNDLLKATLAAPAIHHSFTGPWSPGTNANLLLAEAFAQNPVEGGPAALAKAVEAAAKAAGVEIQLNAEVRRVDIKDGKVRGVTLANGTVTLAEKVAAGCDPKQLFLNLVDPTLLTMAFEANIRNIRARGTTAKVNLALTGYPELVGRPSLKAELIRTGEFFDYQERAFDAVKYRRMSDAPILDIYVPTVETPALAPAGGHVMQILVHFVPHALEGGWTEAARERLAETTLNTLSQYMPNVRSLIAGKQVLTPADLESRYNLSGGHMLHGEHAADQLLVRPTPECSRYATPFEGLYLVGGGAHPGGGLTCAPGGLAARAMIG